MMLKIKDNVDLNDLKKCNVLPRYDTYTGEIAYYSYNDAVTINVETRIIEAVWSCGGMDEEEYGSCIYKLTKEDYIEEIKENG